MTEIDKKIKLFFFPVVFSITGFCASQNNNFKIIENYLNNFDIDSAQILLTEYNKIELSDIEKAKFYYYNGIIEKYSDNHHNGFKSLINAKKIFHKLDCLALEANTNYQIYDLLIQQDSLDVNPSPFLEEYIDFSKRTNDPLTLARVYSKIAGIHMDNDEFNNTLLFYKKSIYELKKIKDTLRIALIEFNIGNAYLTVKNDIDSSLFYYKKTLSIFRKHKLDNYISNNYNSQAIAYEKNGDHKNAIKYYNKSNDFSLPIYSAKTKAIYYANQLSFFKKRGDLKKALNNAEKLLKIKDSINDTQQNIEISKIKEQFDNEKLRADNLEQEKINIAQKARTKQITIGLTSSLVLGSIIAFLVYRNTKRKQRIAEQDRELQIQKTETILKEKELETINAMISGQEKERLRIASELHDNIGSTLAMVRIQVENLERNLDKIENPKALLHKTNDLVNETYKKIRTLSHERNSGVLAKDGLLPAIRKLARTVSSNNNLKVDVQDFGLENRITNELEITIFRIIQELVTNIIKHAQATEANISLTQHDNELNIMVEDNGKGFKVGRLTEKDGMGLGNIERRIEHMEGTMEVDSTPGRGTHITIDIPL